MWLIIALGAFSLYQLPKESSPTIEFGIIQITTPYVWANPVDIDTLITQEIEQEIKDIAGINKITSTSNVWIASTTVELNNDADTTNVLAEIKDAVDKVRLPSDAEDPIVTEISTDNEVMFEVLLYSQQYDIDYLRTKAASIKRALDGQWEINRIDIDVQTKYDIQAQVQKQQIERLGLTLGQLSQTISAFNRNQPIGNFTIGDLQYDFRIDGERRSLQALEQIPIPSSSNVVTLADIAQIEKVYNDDRFQYFWTPAISWSSYVTLTFNKRVWRNIFTASADAKKRLSQELQKISYAGIDYTYGFDLADLIQQDYNNLASNGLQTIILVFLALLFFVGFKESLIATITIPIAFLITFFFLNQLWLSLNFLTNFSLIICFGIAIDTTIVVIEWAHERMRMWYNPKSAVLLAINDYKRPLIAWTTTTCVVFIPLLSLPWITGKFLAYIPITIFITLLAALFLSLTINSALYSKLNKPKKTYETGIIDRKYMSDDEIAILEYERQGKTEKKEQENQSRRERVLDTISTKYSVRLGGVMANKKSRMFSIRWSVLALILSFVVISPFLWFTIFPTWDSEFIYYTIKASKWTTTDAMAQYHQEIEPVVSTQDDIKQYFYTIKDNTINLTVQLPPKEDRKLTSTDIENTILSWFQSLVQQWLQVSSEVQAWWPPVGSAVWLKLVAENNGLFDQLIAVSNDFQNYLRGVPGSKNVISSSQDAPWQFVYRFDDQKLAILWLTPNNILSEVFAATNGLWAWSIRIDGEDYDIKLIYSDFTQDISASDINNIVITTPVGAVRFGDVAQYSFDSAISSISRENTNVTIRVESDVQDGITPDGIQSQLVEYANSYDFPAGITRQAWWETAENADLIQATVVAFFVALLLIFAILTLQFNSYTQPWIIMFSILMWIFGANIWLLITWNPYSMSFAIWFIALTWIIVNDAIVFIDKANKNQERWMSRYDAIVETGKSRLQPILLTTITTILGLSAIAREDPFFAGLAYTIMFGIFFGSTSTLFAIPAIYYDMDKIKIIVKRTIIPVVLFILPPLLLLVFIGIFWLLFGLSIISASRFWPVFGILCVLYVIGYMVYKYRSWLQGEQTIIESTLWLQVLSKNWDALTSKQAAKRFIIKRWLLILPIVLLAIHPAFMILLLGVFATHIYHFRLSDDYQTWHDKLAQTKVIEK